MPEQIFPKRVLGLMYERIHLELTTKEIVEQK